MKLGIGMGYLEYYGLEKGLELMKKQGYETIDYDLSDTSIDLYTLPQNLFIEKIDYINSQLLKNGIEVSQVHGPWRYPPQDYTEEDREERFEKMIKAIYITKLLNCKYIVIHPLMPFGADENPNENEFFDINYDFFTRLLPFAKENGITICIENMPMIALPLSTPTQILNFVKRINDSHFKICLDTGHCAVFGINPHDALKELTSEYVKVLHIHDNDGKRDLHLLPHQGVIDWEKFSRALQETGFEGSASLETFIPSETPVIEREKSENELFLNLKQIAKR